MRVSFSTLLFCVLLSFPCHGVNLKYESIASLQFRTRRSLKQPSEEETQPSFQLTCDFQGPFPYVVSIRGVNGEHRCVGTLISPTSVLTAASCVDPRAGLDNVTPFPELFIGGFRFAEPIEVRRPCVSSYAPGWTGTRFQGPDFAILTFNESTCVLPIPFLGDVSVERALYLIGYGGAEVESALFSGVKTIANMTEIDNPECEAISDSTELQSQERCFRSPDCDCAAACDNDEGAPIIAVRDLRNFTDSLVAVVSYTAGVCNSSISAAVASDLSNYKAWVEHTISTTRCT